MAKRIKIEITEPQLAAIINITDELSSSIGMGDNDKDRTKWVRLIDRMLTKNGYEREYK